MISEKDFSQTDQRRKRRAQARKAEAAGREEGRESPSRSRSSKPKIDREEQRTCSAGQGSADRRPEPEPPTQARADAPRRSRSRSDRRSAESKESKKPTKPHADAEEAAEPKPQPKFDADKIAALLDKRDPLRNAATGTELNTTASLGAPGGMAAQLSQSEIDALRARVDGAVEHRRPASQDPNELIVNVPIRLQAATAVWRRPPCRRASTSRRCRVASRDSAVRASADRPALRCSSPNTMTTGRKSS